MMGDSIVKYHTAWFLWLLLAMPIFFVLIPFSMSSAAEQPVISLTADNENLVDVLSKVAEISGYEIRLKSQWHKIKVSVNITNEPLDKALLMILGKDINHVISWKESENRIVVFIREIPPKVVEPAAEDEKVVQEDSIDKANQSVEEAAVLPKKTEIVEKKKKKWFFRVGRVRK